MTAFAVVQKPVESLAGSAPCSPDLRRDYSAAELRAKTGAAGFERW